MKQCGRTTLPPPALLDEPLVMKRSALAADGKTLIANCVRLTTLDQPCSKSNGRRIVRSFGSGLRLIKSEEALRHKTDLRLQVSPIEPLLAGPLKVEIRIWYRSNRSDLDESLIPNGLQSLVYHNERQVREKHVNHAIDRATPRAEVMVRGLECDA